MQDAVMECLKHINESRYLFQYLLIAQEIDTVSHSILINILSNYGIRKYAFKILENYLQSRKQQVKIGNLLSLP